MGNRKVINATPNTYDGIEFKSILEKNIYRTFKERDIDVQYEVETIEIVESFEVKVPFFIRTKKSLVLKLNKTRQQAVTYTPDLFFMWENHPVYIEVKPAFHNDVYPYKRKLFRLMLENKVKDNKIALDSYPIFAQLDSVKSTIEFINILKTEYSSREYKIEKVQPRRRISRKTTKNDKSL